MDENLWNHEPKQIFPTFSWFTEVFVKATKNWLKHLMYNIWGMTGIKLGLYYNVRLC
jgi:hypothetical protein